MGTRPVIPVILPLLVLLPLTACSQAEKQKSKVTEPAVESLEEVINADITPLADGGAYITGLESGLWYVKGLEAIRVTFSGSEDASDKTKSPANTLLLELTPTSDGGAYASSLLGGGLWYLNKGEATKIREVGALTAAAQDSEPKKISEKWFAMYINELQRRKEAEAESQDTYSPGYDDRDQYQ